MGAFSPVYPYPAICDGTQPTDVCFIFVIYCIKGFEDKAKLFGRVDVAGCTGCSRVSLTLTLDCDLPC